MHTASASGVQSSSGVDYSTGGWPSTAQPANCARPKHSPQKPPVYSSFHEVKHTLSAMHGDSTQHPSRNGKSGRPDPSEDSHGSPHRSHPHPNLSISSLLNPVTSRILGNPATGYSSQLVGLSSPAAGASRHAGNVLSAATRKDSQSRGFQPQLVHAQGHRPQHSQSRVTWKPPEREVDRGRPMYSAAPSNPASSAGTRRPGSGSPEVRDVIVVATTKLAAPSSPESP